jgi:hypothetical protein
MVDEIDDDDTLMDLEKSKLEKQMPLKAPSGGPSQTKVDFKFLRLPSFSSVLLSPSEVGIGKVARMLKAVHTAK